MLDEDDVDGLRKLADLDSRALGFGGAHAASRFIEQQQFGLGRDRHADFEQRDIAVGECARLPVGKTGESELFEYALDYFATLAVARGRPKRIQHAAFGLRGDPQIVGHTELVEYALHLQGARDAEPTDPVRLQSGDLLAGEEHAAFVGRKETRDEIKQRGLAGTVGADNRVQTLWRKLEREIVDGGQAAEALGQTDDAQDGWHQRLVHFSPPRPLQRSRRSRHKPTTPLGA